MSSGSLYGVFVERFQHLGAFVDCLLSFFYQKSTIWSLCGLFVEHFQLIWPKKCALVAGVFVDCLLSCFFSFFGFVKPIWFLKEFCGLWGMNASDCELGAWIQFLEIMNSWKREFWKNVNFGKRWILGKGELGKKVNLGKTWIWEKREFGKNVNFGKMWIWEKCEL